MPHRIAVCLSVCRTPSRDERFSAATKPVRLTPRRSVSAVADRADAGVVTEREKFWSHLTCQDVLVTRRQQL